MTGRGMFEAELSHEDQASALGVLRWMAGSVGIPCASELGIRALEQAVDEIQTATDHTLWMERLKHAGASVGLEVSLIRRTPREVSQLVKQGMPLVTCCLLYTSDAADDMQCVVLGGPRTFKEKKRHPPHGL